MKLRNKKTGEIVERSSIVTLRCKISSSSSSLVEAEEFGSIGQLNEDWEDYKPAKPLIKDEKMRKVVRAWAEANGVKEIIIFDHGNNAPYTPVGAVDFAQNSGHLEIRFRTEERFDTNRIYTIEELCGEEKPRPVIVNDIKYSSYEDYLKSRGKK